MSKIPQSKTDLLYLCQKAQELGASQAIAMPAAYIVVDERTALKCLVPLCSHYGRDLLCPPNVMPVTQFSKVLSNYSEAILIKVDIPTEDLLTPRTDYLNVARDSQRKLHQVVHRTESLALEKGSPFAAGFIGGSCPLCDECVGVKSGLLCRHPFKARPSIEAMGIDVMATAKSVGINLGFGRDESRSWIGLVLV